MKEISITNKELAYGISADEVFWVKNNIISRDQLRQSRDEELVADIVAYMASDEPVASRTELFDDYYGSSFSLTGAKKERFEAMDVAIRRRTPELLGHDFQRVFDEIVLLLDQAESSFSELLFSDNNAGNPVPRYFQAVFLAMHNLIVSESQMVSDRLGLAKKLKNAGQFINIQEGGRWGADNRQAAIQGVIGLIQDYFEKDASPDPAKVHWITRLHNLLMSSKTEQSAYDFKQGFIRLDGSGNFDENLFQRVLETCVGIANIGKKRKGYVIVGVAEDAQTANRLKEVYNVDHISYGGYYVTGIEHESGVLDKTLDEYFLYITEKIRNSEVSEPLKSYICSNLKSVRYFEKTLFVLEVEGQDDPSLIDDAYFIRQGTQTIKLNPREFSALYSRFS